MTGSSHKTHLLINHVLAIITHKNAHSTGGKPIECGRTLFVPDEISFVKHQAIDEKRTFD